MSSKLFINTIEIPEHELRYVQGYIDFEETARTIDRTLVSDFVAFKRRFSLSWGAPVSGGFLAAVLELYLAKDDVVFKDKLQTYTCKLSVSQQIMRELFLSDDTEAFSGFAVELEEV